MIDRNACRKATSVSQMAKANVVVVVLSLGAWFLLLSSAGAAEIIGPSADGTLADGGIYGPFDGTPNNWDWSFNGLGYQGTITLTTETLETSLEHRLVWEYDLSGVTLAPPITATLSFTLRGAPVFPMPDAEVHVYAYPADLAESSGDFSAGPAVLMGSATVQAYQPATVFTVPVTSVVKEALLSGSGKVAFRFQINPNTVHAINQAFMDALDSDVTSKPFITIEAAALADLDGDGDVDTADFLTFANCFGGALNPPQPGCANPDADLDGDGDVDTTDFLTFATCFNGSSNPPKCGP